MKNIFRVALLVFIAFFLIGGGTVYGAYDIPDVPPGGTSTPYTSGGYTEQQIWNMYCGGNPKTCPTDTKPGGTWFGDMYGGFQTHAGYYQWPPGTGNFYPIGIPDVPPGNTGTGGGPEDDSSSTCTGVYSGCTVWETCSPTCGAGTQIKTCFDTGCGSPQTQ